MVIVRLRGGLGNQLFQYAFGRSLAIQKNTTLALDLSWYKRPHLFSSPRDYELGSYPIKTGPPQFNTLKALLLRRSTLIRYSLEKFFLIKYLEDSVDCSNIAVESSAKEFFLDGYWQSESYFSGIRDLLLRELTPSISFGPACKDLLQQAQNLESVAVHIRRGDYISNTRASAMHGVLPLSYYLKTLNYVADRIHKPHFFIFSDDLQWVKKHLNLENYPHTYVESLRLHSAVFELELMRNCRHHIIANSSFSWWGAWLSNSPEQIVIAPKHWFVNAPAPVGLLPNNWIRADI